MTPSQHPFLESIAPLRLDPQAVARRSAADGVRTIGYVADAVPVALILAAGALPVQLRAHPDDDASAVDDLVESRFTTPMRIIAAQWLGGAFDHLDAVIFPRSDDSAQRLYYYVCELQRRGQCRGPRALLYDIANLPRRASFEHTLDSTRRLAAELGSATGALARAMQRVARRESLLQSIRARRRLVSPLPGSAGWAVEFAASCDWREEFDVAAGEWLQQASGLAAPRRVMLAGSPLPDAQMHRAIEDCGACVVSELTTAGEWPADAVADARGADAQTTPHPDDALTRIAATAQRWKSPALAMRQDPRWLADTARRDGVDAVIAWLSEQDEALPWEIARQLQALRADGIPTLLLARQPWRLTTSTLDAVRQFIRTPGAFP
jgi:hypothetical protein